MRKIKSLFILSFLISLITILVYFPTLQNDFVNWDDDEYVYENPNVQSFNLKSIRWMLTSFHATNWHPLTWLSHTIDYAIWGLNPMGHHLTSVIFHGLNTFLVVILITNLISLRSENSYQQKYSLIAGAITGLLFGLHPLHVESVAWVSERKDVLYAFFFLLSILMYIKYVSAEQWRKVLFYGLCLGFFILSLMSKPMAVTLPIVLLILDVYPLRRIKLRNFTDSWRAIGEKVPLFVLSGISVVLTIIAQRSGGAIKSLEYYPLGDRLLVGVRTLGFYLLKIVWPSGLAPFYPYPSKISFFQQDFFLSFLAITVIIILCIFTWKKQKVWAIAWGYYVITLLPVSGIIQVGGQAAADRYTYLPSLAPFLILGLGVTVLVRKVTGEWQCTAKRKVLVIISIVSITIVLSNSTINQIKVWKNGLTLWTREVTVFPQNESGYNGLANAYMKIGIIGKAIEQYRTAIKINPLYAEAHINLATAYKSLGNISKAIKHCKTAIDINPYSSEAHNNLGIMYQSMGLLEKALEHHLLAIKLNFHNPKAHNNLGNAYQAKGLLDEAISQYRIAIEIKDDFAESYYNLGNAYQAKGLLDEAISQYRIAIEIKDDFTDAHYNLAIAYDLKGLTDKADEHFRIARQLNPTLFNGMKSQN